MLRHRLILGPLLILFILLVSWLDERVDAAVLPDGLRPLFLGRDTPPPGMVILAVVAVLSLLAARELAAIMRDNGILASRRVMSAAALIGLAVSCLVPSGMDAIPAAGMVSTAAVLVLVGSLVFYARHRTFEGMVGAAGGTLLAFVYLGLMFGFVLAIRREHSVWLLVWVLLVTKSCDIGAFFTGRALGRHKLIRWLSPGKTWEGLYGGLAVAAAVGGAGVWMLARVGAEPMPPVWTGVAAGAIFGLVGQLGDLMASLFKRDAGIKDSSRLVPGFGGVLDVIDSPLLVAPVAYWWIHTVHPALGAA